MVIRIAKTRRASFGVPNHLPNAYLCDLHACYPRCIGLINEHGRRSLARPCAYQGASDPRHGGPNERLGHLKRAPAIVGQNLHMSFSCTPLYWSRVGSRDPISVRSFQVRHVGVHPWDLGRRFIAIFSTILKAPEASSSRLERGHFGSQRPFF